MSGCIERIADHTDTIDCGRETIGDTKRCLEHLKARVEHLTIRAKILQAEVITPEEAARRERARAGVDAVDLVEIEAALDIYEDEQREKERRR